MKVKLVSAVHGDLREAMMYYLETGGSQISAEFYEEFQRCANLASKSPPSFRIFLKIRRRSEGLTSNGFLTTFCIGS